MLCTINSTAQLRLLLLRLFLQRWYGNFADDRLSGADYTAAGIVALTSDPLHAADTESHSAGDCSGRRAHEPSGKSPQITARRSYRSCCTATDDDIRDNDVCFTTVSSNSGIGT